jgi:hypothetical protein
MSDMFAPDYAAPLREIIALLTEIRDRLPEPPKVSDWEPPPSARELLDGPPSPPPPTPYEFL